MTVCFWHQLSTWGHPVVAHYNRAILEVYLSINNCKPKHNISFTSSFSLTTSHVLSGVRNGLHVGVIAWLAPKWLTSFAITTTRHFLCNWLQYRCWYGRIVPSSQVIAHIRDAQYREKECGKWHNLMNGCNCKPSYTSHYQIGETWSKNRLMKQHLTMTWGWRHKLLFAQEEQYDQKTIRS